MDWKTKLALVAMLLLSAALVLDSARWVVAQVVSQLGGAR